MKITVCGKSWDLKHVRQIADGEDGICEGPHVPKRRILISKGTSGRKRLETYIHELLHAADWSKDEEWIAEAAEDIARVLYTQLGYRSEKHG